MRKAFLNPRFRTESPFFMYTCGYENCIENFCHTAVFKDYYLLHYVIEGEGFYEARNNKYSVSAGEAFVIYPGEVVKYYAPYPDKKWTFVWLGITGTHVEDCLEQLGVGDNTLVFKRDGTTFAKEIVECLKYIDENHNSFSQMMLDGFALKGLASLVDHSKTVKAPDSKTAYTNMAVRFIKDNYMRGIKISDVVEHLNINRSYFYKVFKSKMGISPQQFLIDYKLDMAMTLLKRGYSVGETAIAVGFSDIYSFSFAFKNKYGKPPTHFARKQDK